MSFSLFYVCSVDWNWIKQRPQILGKLLEEYYNVTISYPLTVLKRWKSQKNEKPYKYRKSVIFPLQNKINILSKLSMLSIKRTLRDIENYDAIWLGYPTISKYLNEYNGMIIYDCMDDYPALEKEESKKKELLETEDQILKRANIVFASSQKLKERLEARSGRSDIVLVRNGFIYNQLYPVNTQKQKNNYKIGYFGTISRWFDNEIIKISIDKFENINFSLVGPVVEVERLNSNKVQYGGVVEQSQLYTAIEDCDCLIMPFIINDITEAVDPVKLYEYIAFGKCIISVYYPEIERFNDFVYFYHNYEDYLELIEKLQKTGFQPKYSTEQQQMFLNNNSWNTRCELIVQTINSKRVNKDNME